MAQNRSQTTVESEVTDGKQPPDPADPPGFMEAFVPYFLPGGSNDLEMIRRMGGCPACGEGQALRFENSSGSSFIGDPSSSTIHCERCETTLEGEGRGFRVTESVSAFEGRTLTQDESQAFAAAQRSGDHDRVQELLEKNAADDDSGSIIGTIVSWVAGLLTLLAGYNALSLGNAAAMLFFVPAGLFVLPPVRHVIQSKTGIDLSRVVVIAVFLALYTFGALLYTYAMPA